MNISNHSVNTLFNLIIMTISALYNSIFLILCVSVILTAFEAISMQQIYIRIPYDYFQDINMIKALGIQFYKYFHKNLEAPFFSVEPILPFLKD